VSLNRFFAVQRRLLGSGIDTMSLLMKRSTDVSVLMMILLILLLTTAIFSLNAKGEVELQLK